MHFGVIRIETWGSEHPDIAFSTSEFRSFLRFWRNTPSTKFSKHCTRQCLFSLSSHPFSWPVDRVRLPRLVVRGRGWPSKPFVLGLSLMPARIVSVIILN